MSEYTHGDLHHDVDMLRLDGFRTAEEAGKAAVRVNVYVDSLESCDSCASMGDLQERLADAMAENKMMREWKDGTGTEFGAYIAEAAMLKARAAQAEARIEAARAELETCYGDSRTTRAAAILRGEKP